MMLAGPKNLFTIETDGSLYRISPADGTWSQVGKAGEWKNTIAGTFCGTRLYTVESNGVLYGTNPVSGVWEQVGKAEFGKTVELFASGDTLFSIESDGSLTLPYTRCCTGQRFSIVTNSVDPHESVSTDSRSFAL